MFYGVLIALFTLAANTTFYSGGALRSPAFTANENNVHLVIGHVMTVDSLYVTTITTQPVSGPLIYTIRKNHVDTGLSDTIPAGASGGSFLAIGPVLYAVGDTFSISASNGANTLSATSTGVTWVSK